MAQEQLSIDGIALNDQVNWKMTEFQVIPAKKKLNWVGSALSDGSSLGGEEHYENAEMIGKIRVVQQADMDTSLTILHELVLKLQEARKVRGGLPAVWTPQESTSSFTVYILDAEIEELPIDHTSGWFQSAPAITFHLYLRPFGYGTEKLVPLGQSDPMLADSITNGLWRFDAGSSSGVSISGGRMVFSSSGGKRLYRPSTSLDQTVYLRFRTGTALTGNVGVMVKRISSSTYLIVRFDPATGVISIRKTPAGEDLAISSAFTPAVSTFYWLVGSVNGDEVSGAIYASGQNPLTNPSATPLTTVSHSLVSPDDATYGDGVRGSPGLTIDSTPTSWLIDNFAVRGATDVRSSEPLLGVELHDVQGEVAAEGRLVVDESASQARSHVEWGLEHRTFDPLITWPYLIDSDAFVTSGFTGGQWTSAGAYDPHVDGVANIVMALNTSETVPLTVCSTGDQPHVGTFKVKARVGGTAGVKVRLAWRVGDGQLIRNDFSPGIVGAWEEINLGTIIIPTAAVGGQTWEGRIEAYGVSAGALFVDYIALIPLERYGVARAPLQPITPTVYAAFDNFNQTSGVLHGKTLPAGGTWVEAGATGAISIDTTNHRAVRTQVQPTTPAETLDTGHFALAGSTNYAGVQAQVDTITTIGVNPSISRQGVVARYVDVNNWLIAARQGFASSSTVFRVWKCVAGVVTQLASKNTGSVVGQTIVLSVDVKGVWQATMFPDGSPQPAEPSLQGQDSVLATSGTLQTGKVGIYDAYTSTVVRDRAFDNFVAFAPSQDVVLHAGKHLEIRSDRTEREALTTTSTGEAKYGRVPMYRGSRFFVPCAGDQGRVSRVAVKARRTDVDGGLPDPNISDSITVRVFVTPRYLVAPAPS